MNAITIPDKNHPTTWSISSPVTIAIGKWYQFQYETLIDNHAVKPINAAIATRLENEATIQVISSATTSAAAIFEASSTPNCFGDIGVSPVGQIGRAHV